MASPKRKARGKSFDRVAVGASFFMEYKRYTPKGIYSEGVEMRKLGKTRAIAKETGIYYEMLGPERVEEVGRVGSRQIRSPQRS